MVTITPDQFESEVAAGRFHPVYLLLGPEEYLLQKAVSLLRDKAVPPEALAFNFAELNCRDNDAISIMQAATTFPMISPRRLVLVTDIDALPETDQEALCTYVAAPQETTVLVLVASALDRRSRFFKRLADGAVIVECARLKGPALERWAAALLARNGCRISGQALRKLTDAVGSDLLIMSQEIEKLILYAGQGKVIHEEAIDELVYASRQHGIFEIATALGQRDRRQALRILGNLLESGQAPLAILGMMARHFRQVLIAKELLEEGRPVQEIRQAVQVPEFAIAEFLKQARSIEADRARTMYERLARVDRSIKSGSPNHRMLLEQLVCLA